MGVILVGVCAAQTLGRGGQPALKEARTSRQGSSPSARIPFLSGWWRRKDKCPAREHWRLEEVSGGFPVHVLHIGVEGGEPSTASTAFTAVLLPPMLRRDLKHVDNHRVEGVLEMTTSAERGSGRATKGAAWTAFLARMSTCSFSSALTMRARWAAVSCPLTFSNAWGQEAHHKGRNCLTSARSGQAITAPALRCHQDRISWSAQKESVSIRGGQTEN